MRHLIVLPLFVLICVGCIYDPPIPNVAFKNNSDDTIYLYCTCLNRISDSPKLEQYMLWKEDRVDKDGKKMNDTIKPKYKVYPGDSTFLIDFGSPERPLKVCDSIGKFNIFVIQDSVMNLYSWKTIVDSQMYIERIEVDFNRMKSRDSILSFK